MSGALAGAHFDWPLSRDEKKHHIMQLYDKELQMAGSLLQSQEASLSLSKSSEGPPDKFWDDAADGHPWNNKASAGHGRVSDASTADTEHSACVNPLNHMDGFCDDQLGSIHEEALDDDDINAAHSATARLRQAVAEAAATLQVLASRPSSRQPSATPPAHCPVTDRSISRQRRAAVTEEELSHCSSVRRPSFGSRHEKRRTSRGHGPGSRSSSLLPAADQVDSDGGQGDTEEPMEMAAARRRRRSSGTGPLTQPRAAQRVRSCNGDCVAEEESSKNAMSRSRSMPCPDALDEGTNNAMPRRMPPVVELVSLQDFLGESVFLPGFPW